MSNYRRHFLPGGTFYFTVVTKSRAPLFNLPQARGLLGNVMRECFARYPVETLALALLPDHLHALWQLPVNDARFDLRWRWIKREFTRIWLSNGGWEPVQLPDQHSQRRRGVWQRRYWEHTIRDEQDLEAHFDYIHLNPVKHKLVEHPRDWPWSSYHRHVQLGHYPYDWTLPNSPPPFDDAFYE